MPKTKVGHCPTCGYTCKTASGLQRHIKTCNKRPTLDELQEFVDKKVTINALRKMYQCSGDTVRSWLSEIGQEDYRKGALKPTVEDRDDAWAVKPSELVIHAAPFFKKVPSGDCNRCGGAIFFCRARYRNGLWMLCEAPTKYEVKGWTTSKESDR